MARAYLREGIRTRSQEIATNTLGYRLAHDMLAAREQAIDREQFTELDRALLRRADVDRLVSFEDPVPRDAIDKNDGCRRFGGCSFSRH